MFGRGRSNDERLTLAADLFDFFARLLADTVGRDEHSQMAFQFDVTRSIVPVISSSSSTTNRPDSRISVT